MWVLNFVCLKTMSINAMQGEHVRLQMNSQWGVNGEVQLRSLSPKLLNLKLLCWSMVLSMVLSGVNGKDIVPHDAGVPHDCLASLEWG